MKQLFAITFVCGLLFTGCQGKKEQEFFTGTVNYTYTYSSDSLNADSLSLQRPASSEFRYDLRNYQGRFSGPDTLTYYYSGEQNKCISETNQQRDYQCTDYGTATDSVLSWKRYDTDEKVLGQECRVLELQKRNSWVRYHVSKEFRIAPATYRKHRSFDWDLYGEKAEGGLILKLEHRFGIFTMKGEAVAVKREKGAFTALGIEEKLFTEICKPE